MFGNLERTRIIAFSSVFIGLIALGGWISIPIGNVPVTLQTLFILLAGVIMHRYGAIPVALYVILGALGLPIFHNGTTGIGIILGPTGGFLIGFVFAALVVGIAYDTEFRSARIAGLIAGTVIIYAFGVAWLMFSLGMTFMTAFVTGVLPFIVFDLIKAAAAYTIGIRIA